MSSYGIVNQARKVEEFDHLARNCGNENYQQGVTITLKSSYYGDAEITVLSKEDLAILRAAFDLLRDKAVLALREQADDMTRAILAALEDK